MKNIFGGYRHFMHDVTKKGIFGSVFSIFFFCKVRFIQKNLAFRVNVFDTSELCPNLNKI